MADSTVAALTASDALTGPELFYADGFASAVAADVKVTATQIKTWATSGLTITATTGTFTLTNAKTFSVTGTLTLAGTDGSTLNIGTGGTLGTAALKATGTSGNTVPLLDGNNTWSGTNAFGISTATSLALGGATIGTNALAVTGTGAVSGALTLGTSGILVGGTNLIAMRNGVSAQEFDVFNLFTDINNGEWGTFNWSTAANVLTIGTMKNGTGATRSMKFVIGNTVAMTLSDAAVAVNNTSANFDATSSGTNADAQIGITATGSGISYLAYGTAAGTSLLQIYSRNKSGAGVGGQVMNITNTGNVGINTTAPGRALDINSATGVNLRLTYNDTDGSAANYADLLTTSAGALDIVPSGKLIGLIKSATGSNLQVGLLEEETTIAAAATTDTAIQIPANAIVLAVQVRTTTVIPTAATYTVTGTGSSTTFNTAAVSAAATSTNPGTAAGAYYNATAQTIRITPNAQPADNTGRVRVTIRYLLSTPPTS